MSRVLGVICLFALCSASLMAQEISSQPGVITQSVTSLGTVESIIPDGGPGSTPPPVINVLTVIGDDVIGLPCLDCLLGLLVPTLGLPTPKGKAFRGAKYQIDSYLIDNSYTGPCTFTTSVKDSNNKVLASAQQILNEEAGTDILLRTPVEIPSSAGIGLGTVSTTAVCGSSTTRSQSKVFIACVTNPPYCVN